MQLRGLYEVMVGKALGKKKYDSEEQGKQQEEEE
jgi:hypothetical protein